MRLRGMTTGVSQRTVAALRGNDGGACEHSEKERAFAVMRKLRPQFPTTPEGRLSLAMVDQALKDLVTGTVRPEYQYSARKYLRGSMPHVEGAGVDVDWVRRVIKESGFSLLETKG